MKKFELWRGDCLELMKNIPDGSVDMVLCDLPYGTTRNKWDSVIPLDMLWGQYERITKSNGAILLFAQSPFDKVLGCSRLNMLRYEWIWEKTEATGFLNAKKMPLKAHENILVFYRTLPVYNPQFTNGKPYIYKKDGISSANYGESNGTGMIENTGKRHPRSILRFKKEKGFHPTQKPIALLEYLIKTYTNPGAVVLDNCMGSGSTGVACVNTGRNFIGIELDEGYFNIAKKRIEEAVNGLPLPPLTNGDYDNG